MRRRSTQRQRPRRKAPLTVKIACGLLFLGTVYGLVMSVLLLIVGFAYLGSDFGIIASLLVFGLTGAQFACTLGALRGVALARMIYLIIFALVAVMGVAMERLEDLAGAGVAVLLMVLFLTPSANRYYAGRPPEAGRRQKRALVETFE